jgi:hypothetical protein
MNARRADREEAQRMRAGGCTLRVIAARFAVSTVTALKWTDSEQNAKQVAYSKAVRIPKPCEKCGGDVDYLGRGRPPRRCSPCRVAEVSS